MPTQYGNTELRNTEIFKLNKFQKNSRIMGELRISVMHALTQSTYLHDRISIRVQLHKFEGMLNT